MGIGDSFLPESPVNNIFHQQLLFKGVPHAESHSADNTNGHGIFIHSLLCTDITLHEHSSCMMFANPYLTFTMEHVKNQRR
jgi:hypothetical protein